MHQRGHLWLTELCGAGRPCRPSQHGATLKCKYIACKPVTFTKASSSVIYNDWCSCPDTALSGNKADECCLSTDQLKRIGAIAFQCDLHAQSSCNGDTAFEPDGKACDDYGRSMLSSESRGSLRQCLLSSSG